MPRAIPASPLTVFVSPQATPAELQVPRAPLSAPKHSMADSRIAAPPITIPEALLPNRAVARPSVEAAVKPSIARKPDLVPSIVDPSPRPIVVGMFEHHQAPPDGLHAAREIRVAGFDSAPANSPRLAVGAVQVGAFEEPAGAAHPRQRTDRPADAIAVGRFGSASGRAVPSPPSDRTVGGTVFDGARSELPAPRSPAAEVRTAGFDSQLVASNASPKDVSIARRLDTPVEVIFKPVPDYTEEARALKIEGDVILEVEFTADGRVRVIRTVRGLGHGLDDAAIRAARQIRFKPAQSGGRPADARTTVHIVFRLT